MNQRTQLSGIVAIGGLLLGLATTGQVNPQLTLTNGATVRSMETAIAIAKATPDQDIRIDRITGGLGWLKLVLAGGSFAAFAMALRISIELKAYEYELAREVLREEEMEAEAEEIYKTQELRKTKIFAEADTMRELKELAGDAAAAAAPTQALPPADGTQRFMQAAQAISNGQPAAQAIAAVQPTATAQAAPGLSAADRVAAMSTAAPVQTNMGTAAPTQAIAAAPPQAPNAPIVDTLEAISKKPVSMTIIGVPGAGKGMVASNLLKMMRANHPDIHIFLMEGKGDKKEVGYWEGIANTFRSIEGLASTPAQITLWAKTCIKEFQAIEGPKVLVFDEITFIYKAWSTHDAHSFEQYVLYKIGLSSMGDSLQNYIIEIGQVGNAKDLGVSAGIRSVFKAMSIISTKDLSAANSLLGTKFVPLPDGGKKTVYGMCAASPCGRAVFNFMTGEWEPMPLLPNLSGYDRDTGTFLEPQAKPSTPEVPALGNITPENSEQMTIPTPADDGRPGRKTITLKDLEQEFSNTKNVEAAIANLWETAPGADDWEACKSEAQRLAKTATT